MNTRSPHDAARARLQTLLVPAVAALDRRADHWLEERLAGLDLTLAEFRIVGVLLGQPEGLRQGELARRLGIRPPTLSAALPRLERNGVVERLDDPSDSRAYRVRLRQRIPKLDAVLALIEQLDDLAFGDLSVAERKTLRGALERATTRLRNLASERTPA